MTAAGQHGLSAHQGRFRGGRQAAYARLMRDVLDLGPAEFDSDIWTSFSLFDGDGRCVANVDAATLPLVADGARIEVSGLRSIAVAPDWRGRGLFRELITTALGWCAERSATTFLYTAEPELYGRFDFRPMPQHAFVGPAPVPTHGPFARRLDLNDAADRALVQQRVAQRAPISTQCALGTDPALVLANIAKDEALVTVHAAPEDALIVYENDGDRLVIVDIIAPVLPALPTVLGATGCKPREIKTLFPPDGICWQGVPVPEDTGLMIRGPAQPAMTRPFMFPPTAEF